MNKRVLKYRIALTGNPVFIPSSSTILSTEIQMVDGVPGISIWALVNEPDESTSNRLFFAVVTGFIITVPNNHHLEFIKTFQFDDGAYVMHLFEMKKD